MNFNKYKGHLLHEKLKSLRNLFVKEIILQLATQVV